MDTRERILEVARARFLADGIDGVSMRKIAREVRVSATAIYRHFDHKDELLDALTNEGFDTLETYLRQTPRDAPALQVIRGLLDQLVKFADDHPNDYDFIFIIRRKNVRRFPDDFAQRRSVTFNLLLEQVRRGMEAAELEADDALEASLSIWAHVHGLVALRRAGRFGGSAESFRKLCRRSLERLFSGMCT